MGYFLSVQIFIELKMEALADAKRHHHIEERNRALDERRRMSIAQLDDDLVFVDSAQRIHHESGIEHDVDRGAVILDGHDVACRSSFGHARAYGELIRVESELGGIGLILFHHAHAVERGKKKFTVN